MGEMRPSWRDLGDQKSIDVLIAELAKVGINGNDVIKRHLRLSFLPGDMDSCKTAASIAHQIHDDLVAGKDMIEAEEFRVACQLAWQWCMS